MYPFPSYLGPRPDAQGRRLQSINHRFLGQPEEQHGLAEYRMGKQLVAYIDTLMASESTEILPDKLPELPGDGTKINKILAANTPSGDWCAALIPNPSNICIRGNLPSTLSKKVGRHITYSKESERIPSENYNLGPDFVRRVEHFQRDSKHYYHYYGDGKGLTVISEPSTGRFEVTDIHDEGNRKYPPSDVEPVGEREPLSARESSFPNLEVSFLLGAKFSIDKVSKELISKDGGSEDFDQRPGRVLCEKVDLPLSNTTTISGPASLIFDPKTGAISQFSIDTPEILDMVQVYQKGQTLEYTVKSLTHQYWMEVDENGQKHLSKSPIQKSERLEAGNDKIEISRLESKKEVIEGEIRKHSEAIENLLYYQKPWHQRLFTTPPHPRAGGHSKAGRENPEYFREGLQYWNQKLQPIVERLDKLTFRNEHPRPYTRNCKPLDGILVE